MSDDGAPCWLTVMRAISGTSEAPGDEDNPRIIGMARYIGNKFAEQKEYSDLYQHDSTAWCGLTAAFCMAVCDIRGPFGPTDTDRWMWALSWADDLDYVELEEPVLGCVVVMERDGGGHVTFFEEWDGSELRCRGGNQSDAVNVQSYSPSKVVAYVWPKAGGPTPPASRREISRGDVGSDVREVQLLLLGAAFADGDFGPTTEGAVKGFQMAEGLDPDGVVGKKTWAVLDALSERLKSAAPYLDPNLVNQVVMAAHASALARYQWQDRGVAPIGYTVGMALTYALAVKWLQEDRAVPELLATGERNQPDTDALSWYRGDMTEMGWSNMTSGLATMRHLFVLLIGLGPRESSGNHWEGIDQSAGSSSESADTCEAGLFQSSWNLSTAADEIDDLFDFFYEAPDGWLEHFNDGTSTNASDLAVYGGSGDIGATYQWLAKRCPPFAALMTAVGLRKRRQHWGPINRFEVDLVEEADELLQEIEEIMEEATA